MKLLCIFTVLFISAVYAAPPLPEQQIALPEKCEDVLSVKACDKIKSIAENLRLKTELAIKAVQDAVAKGKNTTEDIYESVKQFYLEKVKTKKCEDFVSSETCAKLRIAGENLKIKAAEVEVFVKKALIEGKKKSIEVYDKVVEYYTENVKGKSCEELLSKTPQVCTALKKAGKAVKVKVEQVTKIVKEALINGYNNATALVKRGINKIKEYASNFTCEELLNPGLCQALREYSAKFKVAFPKIMGTVRDLLVKGFNMAVGFLKAVYKITDAFIDCEHIFTEKSCKAIKEKVTKLGGTLNEFGKAVREFATKAINKTKDIYHKVLSYTKAKWCKFIKLGCSKPAGLIVKRSASISDLFKKYKEMLSKGIAEAKKKLQSAIDNMLDSMNIIDQTVRDVVNQAINDGKIKYSELKALLKQIVDTATGKSVNITALTDTVKTKRDIRNQLVDALKKARGHLKTAIEYLMTQSTETLKKMHNYIQALLKKVFESKSKREIDDDDILDTMADALVKAETEKISKEAEKIADELLDEAIEEAEEETSLVEVSKNKRDLTSGVDKIKELFGKIGDRVKDILSKLRNTNIEEIKQTLKNAGMKLIGVAEDVYKNIKESLEG